MLQRLLLVVTIAVSAACASAANFDLGRNGDLSMDVPESWHVKTRMIDGRGYEFTVTPANDVNARALISLIILPQPTPIDAEKINRDIAAISKRFLADSVEKKVNLQPYKVRQGVGAYTVFTDNRLVDQPSKKGDYKVMAPGILQLTDTIVIVATLFTDDAAGVEFAAMKQMTESIQIAPPVQP